jgi:predicted ATPase
MASENREQEKLQAISTPTRTKAIQTRYDYYDLLQKIEKQGQALYGERYTIEDIDRPPVLKMMSYFLEDEGVAKHYGLDLEKGLMITGPIGCGKTAIMNIMCSLAKGLIKPAIIKCREMSIEFSLEGFKVIGKYSNHAFYRYSSLPYQPQAICFDDLGLEPKASYWGSSCQIMAEILFSRYELFVSDGMITHITTNLNSEELEETYGNRLRSRMRQMFNLIAFHPDSRDKRR